MNESKRPNDLQWKGKLSSMVGCSGVHGKGPGPSGVPFSEKWGPNWTSFFGEISKYDNQGCKGSLEEKGIRRKHSWMCVVSRFPRLLGVEVLGASKVRLGGKKAVTHPKESRGCLPAMGKVHSSTPAEGSGRVWGWWQTSNCSCSYLSTELLKGEPSFFGLLGHDQSRFIPMQRDARTEDGLGGTVTFYTTHTLVHTTTSLPLRMEPANTLLEHKCTLQMTESHINANYVNPH